MRDLLTQARRPEVVSFVEGVVVDCELELEDSPIWGVELAAESITVTMLIPTLSWLHRCY